MRGIGRRAWLWDRLSSSQHDCHPWVVFTIALLFSSLSLFFFFYHSPPPPFFACPNVYTLLLLVFLSIPFPLWLRSSDSFNENSPPPLFFYLFLFPSPTILLLQSFFIFVYAFARCPARQMDCSLHSFQKKLYRHILIRRDPSGILYVTSQGDKQPICLPFLYRMRYTRICTI